MEIEDNCHEFHMTRHFLILRCADQILHICTRTYGTESQNEKTHIHCSKSD